MPEPNPSRPTNHSDSTGRRTWLARLAAAVAVLPVLGRQTVANTAETVLTQEPSSAASMPPSVQPPLHSVPRRG